MSAELETRLREALDARAATTTTSPDGWARVRRRVDRRDHRRSVVLRAAAAAAVLVLVTGGGVVLLRDRNGGDSTVATSRAADDAAGGSAAEQSEGAAVAPFVPVGDGLELQRNADGTIVVRRGDVTTAPVQPGDLSAAVENGVVFGVAPPTSGSVRVHADAGNGVTKTTVADLVRGAEEFRTFALDGFDAVEGPITVEAGGATTVATYGPGGR